MKWLDKSDVIPGVNRGSLSRYCGIPFSCPTGVQNIEDITFWLIVALHGNKEVFLNEMPGVAIIHRMVNRVVNVNRVINGRIFLLS